MFILRAHRHACFWHGLNGTLIGQTKAEKNLLQWKHSNGSNTPISPAECWLRRKAAKLLILDRVCAWIPGPLFSKLLRSSAGLLKNIQLISPLFVTIPLWFSLYFAYTSKRNFGIWSGIQGSGNYIDPRLGNNRIEVWFSGIFSIILPS